MFSFFQRKKTSEQTAKRLLAAAQFRHRLDTINTKFKLPEVSGESKLLREVAQVAAFGAQRIAQPVMPIDELTRRLTFQERLTLATLGVIAANHLSNQAEIEFELASMAAVVELLDQDEPEEVGRLFSITVTTFNALSDTMHPALMKIGQEFANFFATADEYRLYAARPAAEDLLSVTAAALPSPG